MKGLFDRFAASIGIQTDGNADIMDVAAHAGLPQSHPVVELVDRAATRGLGASEMDLRRFFGDPVGADSAAPAAPRGETPARYNWIARRTLDQIIPRIGESHVDTRLPQEVRMELVTVVASTIDPFGGTRGSILSARIQGETAMSRRLVNYLESSPAQVSKRASALLEDASDSDLTNEFEQVPGTLRRRIPQEWRARSAWIEERARLEHSLARAGVLSPSSMLEASARLDMPRVEGHSGPLMARQHHAEIVSQAAVEAGEVNRLNDIDLRFRFKDLGGMSSVVIPEGAARGEWVSGMLVEEAQTRVLSAAEQTSLEADRRTVEAALPPVVAQSRPARNVSVRYSMSANMAQATIV